jgi:hypothetical protein
LALRSPEDAGNRAAGPRWLVPEQAFDATTCTAKSSFHVRCGPLIAIVSDRRSGCRLAGLWPVYGQSLASLWPVSRRSLASLSPVSRRSLASLSPVSRQSPGGLSLASGQPLNIRMGDANVTGASSRKARSRRPVDPHGKKRTRCARSLGVGHETLHPAGPPAALNLQALGLIARQSADWRGNGFGFRLRVRQACLVPVRA